eukprot:1507654-Alexandrium_andersonii.AAC.1
MRHVWLCPIEWAMVSAAAAPHNRLRSSARASTKRDGASARHRHAKSSKHCQGNTATFRRQQTAYRRQGRTGPRVQKHAHAGAREPAQKLPTGAAKPRANAWR